MHPVSFFKNNEPAVWKLIWLVSLIPALLLLWQYNQKALGINPLQSLETQTGKLALLFLLFTLVLTPLRHYCAKLSIKLRSKDGKRLADWNWLIRMKRMLGLYCFFYAMIHSAIYFSLDIAFEWQWLLSDVQEKPYIIMGMLSLFLLTPLALTSTNKIRAKLGKNWRRIHRLIYLIAITTIIHYWWLSKAGVYDAWWFGLIVSILLMYRLFVKVGFINPNPADDGMETSEKINVMHKKEQRE